MTSFQDSLSALFGVNSSQLFFYWKGRVALYALLKAMGVSDNDEVILSSYTCVVVSNSILYCNAKPVYVDINIDDYNMDYSKIPAAITDKTKVIITQNTYGLSSDVERILTLAKKHNIYCIEDCAHGFGSTYNNRPNGTYCDAAFFSMQWNKPISSGLGGFSLINNISLIPKLNRLNLLAVNPKIKEIFMLRLLYFIHKYFLTSFTYWPLLKIYRSLSSRNLILGSSKKEELENIQIPEGYFKRMSRFQKKRGAFELSLIGKRIEEKKGIAKNYTAFLKIKRKTFVPERFEHNHAFLFYPIQVSDKKAFLKLGEKFKIILCDWFSSPLHPIEHNYEQWGFYPKSNPVSVKASANVVCLPTTAKSLKKVLAFLDQYIDFIL